MSKHDQADVSLEYYRRRETEEREAHAAAKCNYAREAHFQLAERYADRAWNLEETGGAQYQPSGLWNDHPDQTNRRRGSRTAITLPA